MARVLDMPEVLVLSGDERIYIITDPTGTPANGYVDIDTLDGRWGRKDSQYETTSLTAGASVVVPLDDPAYVLEMDQDTTLSFPTPTLSGCAFSLWLSGSYTPTFPGSVVWADGTPPTYADDSLYVFQTFDGGTTWIGALVGSALE